MIRLEFMLPLVLLFVFAAQDSQSIVKSVEVHFDRYDAARQGDVANELVALWRKLPESLRDRGLMRIVRTVESATHLFPRDQEYKELRKRHPELPELAVPDRFHVRAYEIAVRKVKVLVENALAQSSRTEAARDEIAEQLQGLIEDAMTSFRDRAGDKPAEQFIVDALEGRRKEFVQAVNDPFAGYLRPLEAKTVKDLRARIARAAESMPKLEFGEGTNPPDTKAFLEAVRVVFEIPRAYCPARFAVYEQEDALIAEVRAYWQEKLKAFEKAYRDKAREEREPGR